MDFRRESYTKNDYRELVESLLLMGEEEYRAFNQKLLPGVQGIIGIRLPILRKSSKEIAKGNYREYLKSAGTEYYEEIMLCGFVIGEAKMALSERLSFIEGFVLKIQNWGVCDSFCAGLKFVKNEKKSV